MIVLACTLFGAWVYGVMSIALRLPMPLYIMTMSAGVLGVPLGLVVTLIQYF